MAKVLKASGNDVEAFWPAMFAKALKGQNVEELLSAISSAPVGGAPQAAPAGGAGGAAPAKKEGIFCSIV